MKDLESIAVQWSLPPVAGSYRPLKPFLLKLADFYININKKTPCINWFGGEVGTFHVAVGADGAPFGKDNTATGKYFKLCCACVCLVSFPIYLSIYLLFCYII